MFAASRDDEDQPHPDVHPDARLVSVFKTSDPGVLPLATMALDGEGLEYIVRNSGKVDSMEWAMSQQPTNRPIVVEIFVTSDVATRARDLLVDLEQPVPASPMTESELTASAMAAAPPSVTIEDAVSGARIGDLNESQLQELTSRLEEDGPQRYFITGATVDMLQEAHVDAGLVGLLRQAVGADGSGRVIRWSVR
jgi:hypothetical protein